MVSFREKSELGSGEESWGCIETRAQETSLRSLLFFVFFFFIVAKYAT